MLTSALMVAFTLGPSSAPEARTDDVLAFVGRVEAAEATIEARHSTLIVEADGPVISGRYELEVWQRKPSSVVAIVTAATDARYAGARFQLLNDELTVQDSSGTYRRRLPDDLRLLAPLLAANFVPLLRDSAPRLVSGPAGAVRELSLQHLPGLPASLAAARVWIDGTTLEPLRLDLTGVLGRVTVRVERTATGVALPVSSVGELGDPRPDIRSLTLPLAQTSDRYALIVMRGALDDERHQVLEGLGVRLHDVLGPSAYVAYVPPDARDAVRSLAFVDVVASVRPEFRYPPALARAAAETTEARLDLLLLAYPEADAAAVAAAIASSGAAILARTTSEWQHSFHVRVPAAAVDTLAQIDGVKWIEGWPAPRIDNDVARNIIGAPAAWSAGFTGAGQTVAVADTGLDTGDQATLSADFRGKVVHTISYSSGWGDPNGHGTHTSGTVLGSGANSSGQLRGVAPGANLVVQAFGVDSSGGLSGVPTDLNLLFRDSFGAGARVASNSWGSTQNIYGAHAQQIDQFVWNNPEMLIVFAAGNNGADAGADGVIDPGSLGTQGNMKNGIAVGASESLRASGNTKTYAQWGTELGTDWSSEPIASDHISDNAAGLAAFSSRGPSRDGRVKPDITAPGTNVLSARSHHRSAASPKYPYNDNYQYLSGTSMATPVVAGAAAVVREFLAKAKGTPNPSAALVKAILLNSATAMEPGQYGPERGAAVFGDDFEAASAAWIADQPWKRTGEDRHSGAWSWKYAGGSTAALTLQKGISLVGASRPILRFWHRYELSSGDAGPRLCFPLNLAFGLASKLFGAQITAATTSGSARVQASVDGGVSWQTVASFNGRSGWAQDRADLSAFAGRPDVRLRFQASSPSLGEAAEWQIDDVEVGSFAPTEIPRRPNWVEGFGRLNLAGAVGPVSFQDVKDGLQTGATRSYTLTATQSGGPLSVMLVWTDYPGAPQAKNPLVNDLDLAVVDPAGRRLYPNGLTAPDRVNNVEQVTIAATQAGTYRVEVTAASVPMGPQRFALVVHGGQLGGAPGYRLPFVGRHVITNGPGCGYHGVIPARREGIDFGGEFEVLATARGIVVRRPDDADNKDLGRGPAYGFGRLVVIRHDDGRYGYYGHLKSFAVELNQPVEQGQLIGISGSTGFSTGVHLHFEVLEKGRDGDQFELPGGSPVPIRDLPGVTWDPRNPCVGEAVGPPIGGAAISSTYGATYALDKPPAGLATGSTAAVRVTVTNTSSFTWPAAGTNPVRLSAHWYTATGTVTAWEGPRAILPRDVAVGGSVTLDVPLRAPATKGSYTIRVDLVHEGITWFSDRGVPSASFTVGVNAGYGATYQPQLASLSAALAAPPPTPLNVTVTNTSTRTWAAAGGNQVRLSYHLRDAAGRMLVWEGKRAGLPADVAAGGTITVAMPLELPGVVGTYAVELDLVHEGVTWFSAEGVATKTIRLVVTTGYGVRYAAAHLPALLPGTVARVPVTLTNTGAFTWTPSGSTPVQLSYHVLDQSGSVVVWEGKRAALLAGVAPDATAQVTLAIEAPGGAGTYAVRLDVVREGVTWFSDKGAAPIDLRLVVAPDRRAAITHATTSVSRSAPQPISVTVTNTSGVAFSSEGSLPVKLASHWLAANGEPLLWEGPRAALPQALLPGEKVVVTLPIARPPQGAALLVVDLVQEGLVWFGMGPRTPVTITP